MEFELKIKNGHLLIYEVDSSYRKYLEEFENRVSQKDMEFQNLLSIKEYLSITKRRKEKRMKKKKLKFWETHQLL